MKFADVYYEGRQMRHSRRGPSDQRYHFKRGTSDTKDIPARVDSVKDALYFARTEIFRVEWTAVGQVARASMELEAPASEIEAMLSDLGYRQKQRMAKRLGLNAGGKEEELDERLRPEIEQLQEQMEEI